ncbi:MAG TPA: ABC transporter ATP-binding protein [Planctomycetaceae bacterium]|nr:ABC transporter ATP-binding protein [Planctomycetaceae bacterium]
MTLPVLQAPLENGPPLLDVRDLRTYFHTDAGDAKAVDGVSFSIEQGKTLAVVGESGCGKTVTALSILQLIPRPPGEFISGEIHFAGRDLLKSSRAELRALRGGRIGMIFQEPGTSLNPVFTIGAQIGEAIALHRKLPRSQIREEVLRSLRAVEVNDPARRIDQYPHEMSGGMKQRAMIAMALSCNPQLLIADEPTTAVDVTIQARILQLLKSIQAEKGMAILLITHDLGVVAELADDVAVMYAGKIIEKGPVQDVFDHPRHPYTLGLFASLPRIDQKKSRLESIEGSVPAATQFPDGCRFRERCRWAAPQCAAEQPLLPFGDQHFVACWKHEEIARERAAVVELKNGASEG